MVGDECCILGQGQFANCKFAFTEVVGLLASFDEPGTVGQRRAQSILDHGEALDG